MAIVDHPIQLTAPSTSLSQRQRAGVVFFVLATIGLLVGLFGAGSAAPEITFWIVIGGYVLGSYLYFSKYSDNAAGIQNDGLVQSSSTGRGAIGWVMGVALTGFYVLLYWFPSTLEHLIRMMDPMSWLTRGKPADQWFLYGFFYTFAVLVMGVRALLRYRHIKYQIVRTLSVMFFQLGLAFLLPAILQMLNEPELYFSYFWPLDYDLLWPSKISELTTTPGRLGLFMVSWGAILTFIATPVMTYFFGKRWYCSWVCGCGGLAETAGDPYRHLSDKSLAAWKVERWMVHGVLVFIIVLTAALWINSATSGAVLGSSTGSASRVYGFLIGAVFSGVVGVGFYPLMGSRVWCRFGCPMAAYLGLLQKYFSRFRISTNGGQCISCGNCSKYCEMGIDVRWYAQRGQNIVRASCVGCGVCSAVCPRGVLRLENGPTEGRYNGPVLIDRDSVSILPD